MKPSHLLISVALLLGIGGIWLIRLRAQGAALSIELEQQRTASQQAIEARRAKVEAEAAEHTALLKHLAEVNSQLATEQQTTAEVTAQKANLESKLPPVAKDDIVVSFGRIRDMAAEVGEIARLGKQVMSREKKEATPEENQKLMASIVKIMAWMPEIAGFEDTPTEISCLQAGTIAKAFDLNSATAARVDQIIRDHFTQMNAMGITAASQDRPSWRDQRSASITQLMWKLRPLLPADSSAIRSLPFILNLGAGLERHINMTVDEKGESHGSVSMTLPNWPRVPWLPEK
jgi:hypothetical protein